MLTHKVADMVLALGAASIIAAIVIVATTERYESRKSVMERIAGSLFLAGIALAGFAFPMI
jgi:hypothetical protein